MAKWLRRLGHRVTVLTTSAYGTGERRRRGGRRAHASTSSACARACTATIASTPCSTPTPTRAGRTRSAGCSCPSRWSPPGRRSRARARCGCNRRERFDCVITSSPPESVHAVGRALARRGVAWVADLRDAWTFEPIRPPFPTAAPAPPRRAPRAALADARPTRSSASAARSPTTCASASGSSRRWSPTAGTRTWSSRTRPATPRGILDPERVSLVYTGRFGSYGRDPGAAGPRPRRAGPHRPRRRLAPRAGGRRAR